MKSSKVVYSHRPPTIFNLMFAASLADAFQDCDDCFPFRYRVNGKLFNFWLEVKPKIQTDVLDELLYADGVAKNILTDKKQEPMDRISQICDNCDLTIRKKKNEIGYSQDLESPKWSKMEPTITVTRQTLQVIDKIDLYLRLSVSISAIDDEVTARIAKASVAFSVFLQRIDTF